MSEPLESLDHEPSSGRFLTWGALFLVVALVSVGALAGCKALAQRQEAKSRRAELDLGPQVRTARIDASGGDRGITLSAEALPFLSTTVYAKLSGFLREIKVDKGSVVSSGQIIAVIESPETDRDFQALKADADNKRRNAQRAEALGKQQLISDRDLDQALADARMAEAKLESQGALKA